MYPELGQVNLFGLHVVLRTYTVLVDLAIVISLAVLAWYGHQRDHRPAAWVDAGLGAVFGGLILGRIGHIAIYWAYFADHLNEVWQFRRGGIDWHLAVLGGLIGLVLVARWRKVHVPALLDALALMLPIGAALIFAGCWMDRCGHGYEVESLTTYPAPLVQELPDLYGVMAPRLATQLYGLAWSILLIGIAYGLTRLIKRPAIRAWIILALLGAGAFGIGFTRGDEVITLAGLRLDQILDLGVVLIGIIGAIFTKRPVEPVKETPRFIPVPHP